MQRLFLAALHADKLSGSVWVCMSPPFPLCLHLPARSDITWPRVGVNKLYNVLLQIPTILHTACAHSDRVPSCRMAASLHAASAAGRLRGAYEAARMLANSCSCMTVPCTVLSFMPGQSGSSAGSRRNSRWWSAQPLYPFLHVAVYVCLM